MKKQFVILISLFSILITKAVAANTPDTVRVGIYITSIHDIDFKQKEYSIHLWLWLDYKKPEFDFVQNLEIPSAKSVTKSFSTIDTSGGRVKLLMKLQCVMKDAWKISNFPFDHQRLRFSIENSQFDSKALLFVADTTGNQYDPRFAIAGWHIDSCNISTGIKAYETSFGDETVSKPHSEYGVYRVKMVIERESWGLFFKMFLGMYVAFLIAYVCFYIHADNIDSRFGLSVGALFAAIGNKYVIDSSLPETSSYTLVDTLHGLTLLFIFLVVTFSAIALKMVKKDKIKEANRFDLIAAQVLFILYLGLNFYFISSAI